MNGLMLTVVVDAAARPRPTSGEGVKSGPLGLAIILVLCVVAYFLFKSMSKHLRNVRENPPTDQRYPTAPGTRGTGGASGAAGTSGTTASSSSAPETPATVPPDERPPDPAP